MFQAFKNLFGPAADFKALAAEGALIIDVRTPQEFKQGHIKGSKNIPLGQLSQHTAKLKKTGKTVITCCASGMRSGSAVGELKAQGIEAYNGGGWASLEKSLK